jgi:N-acetylneuraminic acid mutarotase
MSHQAVLLRDGRVLVLGGESVLGMPTSVAQVYDPSTRAWSSETHMHVARIGFTACVLRDGRVLVVGGVGTTMNDLASAEVFDPWTNTWSMLPALPQTRFSQSASLLPDGRVLLVGGIVQQSIARSTVLFDPRLGRFVAGPATHFLHAQQCALTMPDHRILIAGGYGGDPELYDPASNSWKSAGRAPLRVHPIMTLLPGGSALLVGGTDRGEHDLSSALVFHPAEDRWTATGPLHVRRNSGFGALLPDGQVLIAGGEQVDHHLLKTAELYDPAVRVWTSAAPMHVARSGSTSTLLLDGTVLVCGGGSFIGALSSCETFRPSTKLNIPPSAPTSPPFVDDPAG